MLIVGKDPATLKSGMIVNYKITEQFSGKGEVVGIATTGNAVIGRSIILKDLSKNFPSKIYPFEYFVAFECQLSFD